MEEFVIRVGSKTDPQKLAGSIQAAWQEGKAIKVTAIGPFPISNAFKAIVIANRSLAAQQVMLGLIPGMETKDIDDREGGNGKTVPWVISTMRLYNAIGINSGSRYQTPER